jgi:hypothetical protein
LPDSTWTFVKQASKKLIEKGNGKTALINDFSLITASGTDTTEALLSTPGQYYLLFIKDGYRKDEVWSAITGYMMTRDISKPHFVVSANPEKAAADFNTGRERMNVSVLTCDYVAIKTAARSAATLYLMNGAVIQKKWGWASLRSVK